MITILMHETAYEEFERIRDDIFLNPMINTGLIAANYSTKKHIAIFAFVDIHHVPEEIKRFAKHYHPVTPHTHEEKSADGGY